MRAIQFALLGNERSKLKVVSLKGMEDSLSICLCGISPQERRAEKISFYQNERMKASRTVPFIREDRERETRLMTLSCFEGKFNGTRTVSFSVKMRILTR